MLRVACASVVGGAFRAIGAPRCSRVSTANPRPLFSRRLFYGHSPQEILVTALGSEIKFTQFMPLRPAAPADFPFKVDHHIYQKLQFSRDLDGEGIIVTVQEVPDDNDSDSDDDSGSSSTDSDSDDDNGSSESTTRDAVNIKVKVSKANGKSLNFAATASADEIVIQRLTAEKGAYNAICSELYIKPDSELQFALRDFLEIRGIHKTNAAFLYDYSAWQSKLDSDSRIESVEAYSNQIFPPQNIETLTKLKKVIQGW